MKSVVIQQPNELVIEERQLPVPAQVTSASVSSWPGYAGRIATSTAAITRLRSIRASSAMSFGVIDAVGEGVDSARPASAFRSIR